MLKPYLKAIETRLLSRTQTAIVDIWNSQTLAANNDTIISPSVFIDFGKVQWSSLSNDVKQGLATITVHCVCTDYTNALDDLPGINNRFTYTAAVLEALENYVAKSAQGLVMFKGLELNTTQMSTNSDALKDDVITFNTILYYYDVWRERNWQQIILEGVETQYAENIESLLNPPITYQGGTLQQANPPQSIIHDADFASETFT